jgi:hypothetical protein
MAKSVMMDVRMLVFCFGLEVALRKSAVFEGTVS